MIDTTVVNQSRIFLDKYTHEGDFVMSKSWGEIGKIFVIGWTSPMINTFDNGFALIGSVNDSTNDWHGILLKLDIAGDSLWIKHFYDTISIYHGNHLGFKAIKQTFDKGFIITGQIKATSQYDSDVFLLKTDSIGNTIWFKTYGYISTIDKGLLLIAFR